MRYPRDMLGHGPTPPDPHWPGGAKIAVQFVLNYEEGGENCILHGDAGSEAFLSEIVGAASWPRQRHWNMESIYEYGARSGFWRLHRLFTGADIPVTVYGVATALARSPAQMRAMQQAGWEIASHGLKWVEYKDHTPEDERADMREAIRLHTEVTGARPRGWYTGRCSVETARLASEEGFDYVSDTYADDLPYWQRFGERDQLMIPYTGLHCRLIGRPGRVAALQRFIEYAQGHDDVWFPRRIDIAQHWALVHPPARGVSPSQMDAAAFVAKFGGVFEHSPWIAEGAHALELGPGHDCAAGVHNALARVFRSADREKRLAVLNAHPDLAGKLAAAQRLTAESTAEQAGAGLDALTDAERDTFTDLNTAYTEKHGFPFIIAVRDHDKAGILATFRRRFGQDSETEFAEACRQVERIAELRLADMMS